MTNNYNPRTLVERYIEEVSSLRPLLYRYINVIENIESNISYFVQRALRHEERMEERLYERERNSRSRRRISQVDTERARNHNRNMSTQNTNTHDRLNENLTRLLNNFRTANQEQTNGPNINQMPTARHAVHVTEPSLNFDFLTPVPVIPTETEIRNATEYFHFRNLDSQHNLTCPITQQVFRENERILRIITCGHCFNKRALLRWFTQSVRCPVCRYDIREYNRPDPVINNSTQPSRQERSLVESIQNSISNSILNQVPGFLGQDISANIMANTYLHDENGNLLAMSEPSFSSFTFEIPSTTVPVIETNPLNMPRVTRPQPVQRPPPPPPLSDSSDDSADSDESGNGTVV